ncbi:rod shape-determining protein RodA [Terrilactibacillus sp. BCM23-1]|uniref:Rod shape-determining protein RodA n=1 Tax=Terrilactibacillus tamarindi TaxID=2599694 RepID=A0A6N8CN23_9BACI|nr:FtsW/RodA/SpoVE family cell cycle protein [Terrilactibacillus tamarindi]MTT30587.1 rod shape-determining protein RodA [Terrilactibacillus tamarindi]
MNNHQSIFSKLDYTMIFIIFLLFCISLVALYYAPDGGRHFISPQIRWYFFGFIVFVFFLLIDYEYLKQIHWFLYGFCMLLLIGLSLKQFLNAPIPFVANPEDTMGALSWYAIPGIGNLQPSEFMKIFMTLSMSTIIFKHNENNPIRTVHEDLVLLGKLALISGPPFLIVLAQPDLGTALVMFSIIFCIVLVSGIRWQFILAIVSTIIASVIMFFVCWFKFPTLIDHVLESHQKARFYGWLDPVKYSNEQGFQLIQSLHTIGPGQMLNFGLDTTSVNMSEGHTDFIFAVIAGSFGFIGASIVIGLYFILIYRMVHAAISTHDHFGSYIITGFIGMFMFQVFENIGMTIQVMPITGITLPFLSYGGSSIITSMMAIGITLSIQSRKRTYMFH